jgi:putative ABC transport system permease protein
MSWLRTLRTRFKAARRSANVDDELAEEFAYHLELETARQRSLGFVTPVAQERAMERFGDPNAIARATMAARGSRIGEPIVHDLRSAWCSLRHAPGFTLLALLTLALGIAATVTAFTVLDTVLLRPLPYRHPEQLVLLEDHTTHTTAGDTRPSSYPNFADWRSLAKSFSGVISLQFPFSSTVGIGDETVGAVFMGVSRDFFRVLGVPMLRGRPFTEQESAAGAPASLIVSSEFWETQLGGRADLGTVRFAGTATPIVGVLPPGFRSLYAADVYLPHERWPATCRTCSNYRVIARIAPGVTRAAAQREMDVIASSLARTYGHDELTESVELRPLREWIVGDYRALLAAVFGSAALVLLIACTNLVGAQLARGLGRGREIAVRAALGASYGRLVRGLLLESLLLATGGAVLGTLMATGAVRVIRSVGAGLLPRLQELQVDGRTLGFALLVTALTALLSGAFPAMRLAVSTPGRLLGSVRGSAAEIREHVWRTLVGAEIALAVVLLVGAALLIRTFHNILTADTGFDPTGLACATMPVTDSLMVQRLETGRAALASLPGVTGVAWTTRLPLTWGNESGPVRRPTDPADRDFPAYAGFRVVSPDYFGVLRLPMLQGRPFMATDREGTPGVAIITPGIARALWPGEDPIGKPIITNYLIRQTLTVVGVVTESSSWTMPVGKQNEIYVPVAQQPSAVRSQLVAVLRTPAHPNVVLPLMRARLHDVFPDAPPLLETLPDRIERTAADRRFAMLALFFFGGVALVLASVGVYGTMSYRVTARTREIGVRVALGATSHRILRQVLRQAAATAITGASVGLIAGALLTRLLSSMLYGVDHRDPAAYASAAVILVLTAVLSAWLPGWRASRVDPVVAMRVE